VLLTVALLLRIWALLIVGVQSGTSIRLDVALVLVTGMLTALWGNVGYLGVAMEHAQRLEGARRAELAAATARGEQAERQAAELKALSDERQELLRVISHEVRQPIHNAQAVLQGWRARLAASSPKAMPRRPRRAARAPCCARSRRRSTTSSPHRRCSSARSRRRCATPMSTCLLELSLATCRRRPGAGAHRARFPKFAPRRWMSA